MKGYRKEKTTMGRRFWVKMDEEEILERKIYHIALVGTPLITILFFALASGMLMGVKL